MPMSRRAVRSSRMHAAAAAEPSGASVRRSLRATTLRDRGRELSELEAAIHAAQLGEGGVVVVEGPAGIGKSALLRASAEIARALGVRPLTARGLELEREVAF